LSSNPLYHTPPLKTAIQAELLAGSSSDRTLLRELREVEDQMAKAEIKLIDEVDMKLTEDEKISHANAPYCLASVLKC
jgi:hypothetical protein